MDTPTFDLLNLVFSGFAFIGVFYSVKLLVTKRRDERQILLGIYLLLQSLTVFEYVLYWTKLIFSVPVFAEFSLLFPLLYGPLLMVYVNRSFGNDNSLKTYGLHFVPFLVLLAFKIPFYVSPANLKLYHTHEIMFGQMFDYYPWLMLCHLGVYAVVMLVLIENHSGVGVMRSWARWLTAFFIAYVLFSLLYYALTSLGLLNSKWDHFIALGICMTILLIAWYNQGFEGVADGRSIADAMLSPLNRNTQVSSNEMIIESKPDPTRTRPHNRGKYEHSGLPKNLAIKLAQDMELLMEKEKLYQQNDLSLEFLAAKLNSSKHFVSQVINQHFKMNFFEYVNLKRIEEAKQLLRNTPRQQLNIIQVAYSVGFNNKGTFNSVFKKTTGVTPTDFRKQSQQLLNPGSN